MSRYCEKCGQLIKENETFCSGCGNQIKKSATENKRIDMKMKKKQNNGLSVGGFICSIVGVITCGLTSLIGLVLSLVGFLQSKKKGEKDPFALAGIIISSIIFGLWIIGIIGSDFIAKPVKVEDFSKMTQEQALNYCEKSILNCTFSEEYSDTIPKGEYIRQSIEAGEEIKSYRIVDIVYSKGPEKDTNNNTSKEKKENNLTKSTDNKQLDKIKNKKLRENFIIACKSIKMDASKIKNVKKVDDWNSGPRYTFTYKNTEFILYAYDDGSISSITIVNNNLDKIYLEGYEPYNVNDYLLSADKISDLQITAEKSIKRVLNHPDTVDFHWTTTGAYSKSNDIYIVTGKFDAKNSFGVKKESSFYIEEQIIDGSYSVVYMTIDKEKYIGTESKTNSEERKRLPESTIDETMESNTITLKEGQKGKYGKDDYFDGEAFVRYYIPAGKYEVVAKTKNAQFFIESVAIYKENGYDTSTEIRKVHLAKAGDKETIEITPEQCIMLVAYTKIELTKIE